MPSMHALLLKFPFDEHKRKREFNSMEIALIGIENNLSARRNYNHQSFYYNKFVQEQMEQQIAKVQTANQKTTTKQQERII